MRHRKAGLAVLLTMVVALFVFAPIAAGAAPTDCTISGTSGDDNLSGTPGDDKICAYGGHDTVFGHAGNDSVHGGGGRDRVNGGQGEDTLKGAAGDDVLQADEDGDADTVIGGAGFDRCVVGPEDTTQGCEEIIVNV